ncbi:MAG: hypothetical protein ACXWXF_07880 [Aeromicrobium sp.]
MNPSSELARRLSDVAGSLGERLDEMARLLNSLQKHAVATQAETASTVAALAGHVVESGERSHDELVQVRADVAAHKVSTISEVVDLLRLQTESLRNDLVARLAETDASD